jgi:protease IV
MPITSDNFIERSLLKKQLAFWRLAAVGVFVFFLIVLIERNAKIPAMAGQKDGHVARVVISGEVGEDREFYKLLDEIRDDEEVKAVILHLDTPGGSAVAGETIFRKIKDISKEKPVVASMRSVCASAGYMISLAADRTFTMNGTITGSIGVILQTVEFSELADKIGVHPITLASGKYKAVPSNFEPLSDDGREVLDAMIQEFHSVFVNMVAEGRKMPEAKVRELADGRIFSGPKAVELNLVDEIGGEEEALAWLQDTHDINPELEIEDKKVKSKFDNIYDKLSEMAGINHIKNATRTHEAGLQLLWVPSL